MFKPFLQRKAGAHDNNKSYSKKKKIGSFGAQALSKSPAAVPLLANLVYPTIATNDAASIRIATTGNSGTTYPAMMSTEVAPSGTANAIVVESPLSVGVYSTSPSPAITALMSPIMLFGSVSSTWPEPSNAICTDFCPGLIVAAVAVAVAETPVIS